MCTLFIRHFRNVVWYSITFLITVTFLHCDACCLHRLYGVDSEFLSPTAIKARLPLLRTEDLLVGSKIIYLLSLLEYLRPFYFVCWERKQSAYKNI